MNQSTLRAIYSNFLGQAPTWYKTALLIALLLNPLLLATLGPFVTGWILIFEFIATLALALKCYPLQPGGLLVLEALLLNLVSPATIYQETQTNFSVILLLIFMVAGIYFMKDLLLFSFTKLLLSIRSKAILSLAFCAASAFLSAFLDALTVIAVIISVCAGFYAVYHEASSEGGDALDESEHKKDLFEFRAFLASLVMHSAIGTTLGGVCTMVGEPQNLLIAHAVSWNFSTFFFRMAPVTLPVLAIGLLTCLWLEKTKWFGYGVALPSRIRSILQTFNQTENNARTRKETLALLVQGITALILIFSLAFHVAEAGLIGLMIIILMTAFNGITEEHQIGKAFEASLPFTGLLVAFFAIVGVIHEQHLFKPITDLLTALPASEQPRYFYLASGLLSAISDNVFVASIYINEALEAFKEGLITRTHLQELAIAINLGTNVLSVATPNGQAAFLFLLTSTLSPLIRLSYGKMLMMAFPYTVTLGMTGFVFISLTM